MQKIYFMSKQFSDLGINRELQARLKDIDIVEPTEVQKKVIPFILQRKKDLVALLKQEQVKPQLLVYHYCN